MFYIKLLYQVFSYRNKARHIYIIGKKMYGINKNTKFQLNKKIYKNANKNYFNHWK